MIENVIALKSPQPILAPWQLNARDLTEDLAWCEQVIDARFKLYFRDEETVKPMHTSVFDITPPNVGDRRAAYGDFIVEHGLDFIDRLTLILALLPALKPKVLDVFLCPNDMTNRPYTEFGCIDIDGCVFATVETLAFILGGDDLTVRLQLQQHFAERPPTTMGKMLHGQSDHYDPLAMKTVLRLNQQYLHLFTTVQPYRPDLSVDFPAQQVSVDMDWDDLVLAPKVLTQLQQIQGWIKHGSTLLEDWGLGSRTRSGYRALLYGPPGTGKTLAACLLGKSTGRDVYKVDLSLVVSKYIGETEKNLEKVFAQAEHKSWILFFDEADALFGKRIVSSGANDQFANQNVSYLLQRIERFNGITLLASNFKDNFDSAFFRRFESMIYFPLPTACERLRLWQQGFSVKSHLAPAIDLTAIANAHALSGAQIINVIRYASLQALCAQTDQISEVDLTEGIHHQLNLNTHDPSHSKRYDDDIFGA